MASLYISLTSNDGLKSSSTQCTLLDILHVLRPKTYLASFSNRNSVSDVFVKDVEPVHVYIGYQFYDEKYQEAYVTLATNDAYSVGCLVLAKSLRKCKTSKQLAVMITSGVTRAMIKQLEETFDYVKEVHILDSEDDTNLQLLGRPDLGVTLTKINCWLLTNYTKCVFLDADSLVLQSVDDLFLRDELSAAPDVGWPDCFNSGVFVYKPSRDTYQALKTLALTCKSFDGGDQGLLNMYFKEWATADIRRHLSFTYNVTSHAFYSYLPAYLRFKNDIKIIHFIGPIKPWHHIFDLTTNKLAIKSGSEQNSLYLNIWWSLFVNSVLPKFTSELRNFVFNLPYIQKKMSCISIPKEQEKNPEFEHIKQKLDVAMAHGTGERFIDASKAPFPALVPYSGNQVDIALLTNECMFKTSGTQVSNEEIIAEMPKSRKVPIKPCVTPVVGIKPAAEKPPIQPLIEPKQAEPTATMPQKPTKPKVVVKSVTKPEGEPLGEIWTRVDIDNANRMLTKVSADKDSSAKFRVKSITGEAAKESMKMSKDANLMEGSDTVKMLLEFQCQYVPRKNVVV